mmetsp:Transcript_31373/g.69837  ORF Transcript_31373/g.69837 Transcript_31373/m.69837 type:complete len:206 (-) Transcript_31373:148-765(-)
MCHTGLCRPATLHQIACLCSYRSTSRCRASGHGPTGPRTHHRLHTSWSLVHASYRSQSCPRRRPPQSRPLVSRRTQHAPCHASSHVPSPPHMCPHYPQRRCHAPLAGHPAILHCTARCISPPCRSIACRAHGAHHSPSLLRICPHSYRPQFPCHASCCPAIRLDSARLLSSTQCGEDLPSGPFHPTSSKAVLSSAYCLQLLCLVS